MALVATGPSALWYLTRATGSVTLMLLTASVALGVANVGRLQSTRWPRFVVEGLHRNVSMLAIAVLCVHIVTTVLDPFASIHLVDAVVPFVSTYRPFWLGLGAFASDLLIAIAITSVVPGVWATAPGASRIGSPTPAGRSRCCMPSAPAATSSSCG